MLFVRMFEMCDIRLLGVCIVRFGGVLFGKYFFVFFKNFLDWLIFCIYNVGLIKLDKERCWKDKELYGYYENFVWVWCWVF